MVPGVEPEIKAGELGEEARVMAGGGHGIKTSVVNEGLGVEASVVAGGLRVEANDVAGGLCVVSIEVPKWDQHARDRGCAPAGYRGRAITARVKAAMSSWASQMDSRFLAKAASRLNKPSCKFTQTMGGWIIMPPGLGAEWRTQVQTPAVVLY